MDETDEGDTGFKTLSTTSAAATTTAMSYAGELRKQTDDTMSQTAVTMLTRDMTSVGALISSNSCATCFRVGTKYIMTAWHVVRDIVGLLSDLVLNTVAAKLGFEWQSVAIHLGLPQKQIEQIQMDHPGNTKWQIQIALTRWRDTAKGDNSEKIEALIGAIEGADNAELAADLRQQYCGSDS